MGALLVKGLEMTVNSQFADGPVSATQMEALEQDRPQR